MSRHFVWSAPLTYFLLFLAIGLLLAAVTRLWPGGGGWLSRRLIVASAFVPALMVAFPQIYTGAWMIAALGMASRIVPSLERHAIGSRRWLLWSFPGLLGMVLVMAGSVFAGDWVKERRQARRPLPPADSPNVLLIVMDTVRTDRLSLYGYHRPTTPNRASWPSAAFASIKTPGAPPHRGRCPPTRAYSRAAGPMSSAWNG